MSDTETIEKEETDTDTVSSEPGLYKVLIHNDNQTTYDFVIAVLGTIFHKTHDEAFDIAIQVDRTGVGLAGIYAFEVAEQKTEDAMEMARKNNYPLLTTFEEL